MLFGSRVTGHATSRSDWDVAVLHKGANPPKLERLDEFWNHHIDVPMPSIQELRQEAICVGSLSHELLSHGEAIAGDGLSFEIEELVLSEDLAPHLEYSFTELVLAICELTDATGTVEASESIEDLDADRAVAHSAMVLSVSQRHSVCNSRFPTVGPIVLKNLQTWYGSSENLSS